MTERYNKPSVVFKIDTEREMAVASLRGPEYFNIIQMLGEAESMLIRF
ncbi:MAG: hypothetical protein WCG25_06340 [bacterium]